MKASQLLSGHAETGKGHKAGSWDASDTLFLQQGARYSGMSPLCKFVKLHHAIGSVHFSLCTYFNKKYPQKIPVISFISCVTLDKLINLLEPLFLHL